MSATAAGAGSATSGAGSASTMAASASADGSWAAHDADKDGALSPLEFAMHVDAGNRSLTAEAKRERFSRASGNGAIKLLNATADQFSKADANRDRRIDGSELAAWQGGGSMGASAMSSSATTGAGTATPLPDASGATDSNAATMTDSSTSSDMSTSTDSSATPPNN
jgi:hypothetical protein